MLRSSVQHKILKSITDDRPITAIQVIENLDKCPPGFYPISRTHDQDQDADLRESSLFFRGTSPRYICLSKTEGLPNFVIQDLFILSDKISAPKGFSLLSRTADSEQKAWRKKQLCYRLVNLKETRNAITDIIVCSRLKKAPQGFKFVGEFNGALICFKMGNVQDTANSNAPARPPPPQRPLYPNFGNANDNIEFDYEILLPKVSPNRPAPKPPTIVNNGIQGAGNISTSNYLDGIPFVLNPRFAPSKNQGDSTQLVRGIKNMSLVFKELEYNFVVERQTEAELQDAH